MSNGLQDPRFPPPVRGETRPSRAAAQAAKLTAALSATAGALATAALGPPGRRERAAAPGAGGGPGPRERRRPRPQRAGRSQSSSGARDQPTSRSPASDRHPPARASHQTPKEMSNLAMLVICPLAGMLLGAPAAWGDNATRRSTR